MASTLIGTEEWVINFAKMYEGIRERFSKAHQKLEVLEAQLTSELKELEKRHKESENIYEGEKQQLSNSKEHLLANIKGNDSHLILQQAIAPLEARIRELENEHHMRVRKLESMQLEWDGNWEEALSVAGFIVEKTEVPNYKEKDLPIMIAGKHSKYTSSTGEFRFPRAIAIDKQTNKVYICDTGNHRVQVYSESLEFMFTFSEKMNGPIGICVDQEIVYITQYYAHSLNVYSMHGNFMKKVGSNGTGKLQFTNPCGIAISPKDRKLYICDNDNDRIQCLKNDLTIDSSIHGIYGPRDIKLTADEIIVLNGMNPCLHIYDYTYHLIREMLPCGEGNQLSTSHYFTLDNESNILLTDYNSHCILIFDRRGVLLHKLSKEGNGRGDVIEPTGIAIDSKGRIIVISENADNCVQLF